MTALAPTAAVTYPGVLEGWRSWRIMVYETLDGEQSYRLCACGTRGLPPVWEPLQPTVAVCSQFNTHHAAPWPSHECGIHAYRNREPAWAHLQSFVETTNGDEAAGWAFGRVRLWGRVVEHQQGWRAQYAYPANLTVHAAADIADAISGLYRVDVAAAAPLGVDADDDDEDEGYEPPAGTMWGDIRAISAELTAVGRAIETLAARVEQRANTSPPPRPRRWCPFFHHPEAIDRLIAAVAVAAAADKRGATRSRQVADALQRLEGAADDEQSDTAATTVGAQLARLALSGRVTRFNYRQRGVTPLWAPAGTTAAPEGYVPAVDHDRPADLAVLRTLVEAERELERPVFARELAPRLDGAPRVCDIAAALVRCRYREWVVREGCGMATRPWSSTEKGREAAADFTT